MSLHDDIVWNVQNNCAHGEDRASVGNCSECAQVAEWILQDVRGAATELAEKWSASVDEDTPLDKAYVLGQCTGEVLRVFAVETPDK